MSEANLNETVEEVVSDAQVVTVPIDDTLSVSGDLIHEVKEATPIVVIFVVIRDDLQ